MPRVRIEATCTGTITTNASARVTLMSLVGGPSHSISDPMPSTENQSATRMNTNRATASGTTAAPRGPIEPSTWRCTACTPISHASCSLPGTPLVARARRTRPRVMTTAAATPVAHSVSRFSPHFWTWVPTLMSAASRRTPGATSALTACPPGSCVLLVVGQRLAHHGVAQHRVAQHGHHDVGEQAELEDGQPHHRPEGERTGHEHQGDDDARQ